MDSFPHRYTVTALAGTDGEIMLESEGLQFLRTALPTEFGGPGNRWSPETLFVAAIADCYALTFRALAKRSKLEWTSLVCDVVGTLDRNDHVTRFVEFDVRAKLQVPEGASHDVARRLLVKAEETCLVTRSLTGETRMHISVEAVVPQVV